MHVLYTFSCNISHTMLSTGVKSEADVFTGFSVIVLKILFSGYSNIQNNTLFTAFHVPTGHDLFVFWHTFLQLMY